MKRDDYIGLGASLGVHLLLLAIFALTVAGRAPTQTLGAVQVQIGAFAEGQPVQQQVEASSSEAAQKREAAPAPTQDQKSPSAQQESTPVNLPEQKQPRPGEDPPTEEQPPEELEQEAPPVAEPSEPLDDEEAEAVPESSSEESEASGARPPAEGEADASGDTDVPEATEGTGDEQEKAAPYDIEGLNRTRLRGALPQYTDKVNAVIKVQITVDPQGRVVGRRLLRKANPSLERSVLETLARWRFDPLPRNAPQENQTGVVTFRFRLE